MSVATCERRITRSDSYDHGSVAVCVIRDITVVMWQADRSPVCAVSGCSPSHGNVAKSGRSAMSGRKQYVYRRGMGGSSVPHPSLTSAHAAYKALLVILRFLHAQFCDITRHHATVGPTGEPLNTHESDRLRLFPPPVPTVPASAASGPSSARTSRAVGTQ